MGGCQCWLCSSAGGSRASHVRQRRLIRAPASSEHVLLCLLGPRPSLTNTKILAARGRPGAVFRPSGSLRNCCGVSSAWPPVLLCEVLLEESRACCCWLTHGSGVFWVGRVKRRALYLPISLCYGACRPDAGTPVSPQLPSHHATQAWGRRRGAATSGESSS